MTVSCTSTAGFSGPHLGVSGTVNNTVNLRSGTYTIACRVRWDTSNTSQDHIAIGIAVSAADGSGLYIQRVGGETATQISAYRTNTSGTTLQEAIIASAYGSTTAWHHVCATYDGTTLRTYLDGVASGTIASGTTTCTNANAGYLVVAGPATNTTADSVFFKRALTAQEVFQLARERLPLNRRSDCIGWYPMLAGGSNTITDLGRDYSGYQNDASIQASGTGNPAVSNVGVPSTWGGSGNRIIYTPGTVVSGSSSGTTNSTGTSAATLGESAGSSGTTNSTGASAVALAVTESSTGTTNSTGASAASLKASESSTGTTNSTGASAAGISASEASSGTTNSSGASTATLKASESSTGTTSSTGASAIGIALGSAGSSQSTGASAVGIGIGGAGTTNSTGASVFSGSFATAGTTQSTGASAAFVTGDSTATSNGTTNSTGDSAPSISTPSSGTTQSTGTSAVQVSAGSVGLTMSSSSGVFQGAVSSSGLTKTSGASAATGGGSSGLSAGELNAMPSRRGAAAGGMRRRLR